MRVFCAKMYFLTVLLKTFILLNLHNEQNANAKSDYDMVFDNCTCSSGGDTSGYLSLLSCYTSKNVRRRTFSIELQFARDVRQFHVNLRIELPRKNGDAFTLFNLTQLDGCKLLGNKNQVTLVQLGRSTLDRFGNIPKQCPFRKDVLYFIRAFRVDMKLLPAFAFETKMDLWFDFLVERRKVIQGFIQSHMFKKNSKQL